MRLLIVLLVLCMLAVRSARADGSTASYSDVVLADGPLLYWRLDGAGVDDLTGNGEDGAVDGGVNLAQAGALANEPSGAATFDGGSGFIVATKPLDVGGDFTIEAWVKAASRGQSAPIVSLDAGSLQSRTLYLDDSRFEGRLDQSAQWPSYVVTSASFDPTTWHHVVFSVQGSTNLALYVDGIPTGTANVAGTSPFSATPMVAWSGASWLNKFAGSIGEVALYPRALTAARVQAHFQAGRGSACSQTLQAQVDAAAAGSTLSVPGCVYREMVTVSKPLTLVGQAGAEIRGSDVWSSWSSSGRLWTAGPVPLLAVVQDSSRCAEATHRCLVPYQVFVDGTPLTWVPGQPSAGQFSVDGNRMVVLADNPNGHTVEVTTRQQWVVTAADGVTIQGFSMRHAGNDAQTGAISNDHHSSWTLQNNVLSDAHGDVVSVDYGSGTQVLDNDISRGGDLGVHGDHPADLLVQGNTIHHNSVDAFYGLWEAGAIKIAAANGLTIDNNEISYSQVGPGVWCDVRCTNVVYSRNRVHHNAGPGLFFEISNGARIFGNVVWENAWSTPGWGNAGIGISSSANAEVYGNTLAWNAGGIAVISQNRPDAVASVAGNFVHDNTIMETSGTLALAWLTDASSAMFDQGSGNHGANNVYWYPDTESGTARFAWAAGKARLDDFNATPGERNGRYLSSSERDDALQALGLPASRQS